MNLRESALLLLTRFMLEDDPREEVKVEAERIVDELGHLSLVIEQAVVYIRNSQNIMKYLFTYRQNRKALLEEKLKGNHPYEESVDTT